MSMNRLIKRLEEAEREKVDYWRSVNGQNIGFRGTEGKGDAVVGPSAIIGGGSGGASRPSRAVKKFAALSDKFEKVVQNEIGYGYDEGDSDDEIAFENMHSSSKLMKDLSAAAASGSKKKFKAVLDKDGWIFGLRGGPDKFIGFENIMQDIKAVERTLK
jgi:hypothetical protein